MKANLRESWPLAALAGACCCVHAQDMTLEAPNSSPHFDSAEFVLKLEHAPHSNPFTELEFTGEFTRPAGSHVKVFGFCDAQDGRVFRLRFCPEVAGSVYDYRLCLRGASLDRQFSGQLRCEPSSQPGPVIADPKHPPTSSERVLALHSTNWDTLPQDRNSWQGA